MKRTFFSMLILVAILSLAITPALAGGSRSYLPVVASRSGELAQAKPKTLPFLSGTTVDLLIRTDGDVNALAKHIRDVGGTVKYQYRNVPIVAATIPFSQWAGVAAFPGVVHVEKDGLVQLAPDKNKDKPLNFETALAEGETLTSVDAAALDELPEGYVNYLLTGASTVWSETGAGDGSIVAVVDSGTAPNACLYGAVIGAPGFPNGYNATGDGIPADSKLNYWHGTFVGGVIASSCQVNLSPSSALYKAINKYLPFGSSVLLMGQAPLAQIYPVKVFNTSGAGSPTSVILDGLDNVLSLKTSGALDIDIVNMSLSGPTLYDGRDAYAAFVKALTDAGILVVSSASNDGPTPNTIGSPATSDDGIAVGGLDYAVSSRIFYEYLGLAYMGMSGEGEVMRPTTETRVVNFSSRGPLSDGREGPDISALALWNFEATPTNSLSWAGGTSFSAPTVAGGAALLNAYLEAQGQETDPSLLKNALLAGANPFEVGVAWQAHNDQGFGALDVPAALEIVKYAPETVVTLPQGGNFKANVFKQPVKGKVDSFESDVITLNPSEKVDFVLEVNQYTSKVSFDVIDITTPDNSAYAYYPNGLQVDLQSAKRSASTRPISWIWYPYWDGNAFNITVEDGLWTYAGVPWAYQPMEPGLMKFTLSGDYVNESPVSFKVSIVRENFRPADKAPYAKGQIKQSDVVVIPVTVPAGATRVQFDLRWLRDWSMFPTSDLDMYVYDPGFNMVSVDGASLNSPERAVVDAPAEGVWYVLIDGYQIYRPDTYQLFVKLN